MQQNVTRPRIASLPRHVAEQIAAGEVVDRPVSIVKELIENSIDAGCTSLILEFRNGGKTYLRVTDNGSGILKEDVTLAFQRHATSKISTVEDLESVETLGFRGEALASIAAVSKVELITKVSGERTGMRLLLEGGELLEQSEVGCPDGTTIIVTDLFYNTPARHKFMKPDSTETSLIVELVTRLTLAYPEVKFRLIQNGQILFSTNGKGDRLQNIQQIYQAEQGLSLLHHTLDQRDGMVLDAYLTTPGYSKPNRKHQIYFVNGRAISSKVLDRAVSDAYQEKLPEGRYPMVFLFLQLPPSRMDVNIHPNKREVRFEEEQVIQELVKTCLEQALLAQSAVPKIPPQKAFRYPAEALAETAVPQVQESVDVIKLQSTNPSPVYLTSFDSAPVAQGTSLLEEAQAAPALDFNRIRILGTAFSTYLIGQDQDSLYLIDQHAAHERVYYEQIMDLDQVQGVQEQTLLAPVVVPVTYATQIDAREWIDFLRQKGFSLEEFGSRAFLLKGIPAFLSLSEAEAFLSDFFEQAGDRMDFQNQKAVERIISHACRMAVKAHDVLSDQEIRQLLSDLSQTRKPYSCPHGRPTILRMTRHDLERYFKRV